jgi:hypothetical protein
MASPVIKELIIDADRTTLLFINPFKLQMYGKKNLEMHFISEMRKKNHANIWIQ